MRTGLFREHLNLLLLIGLLSFLSFDEEPLLDLTDLNALHVWVLVFCLSIVLFEPTLRGRVGQLVYKDTATLVAALTFWLGLENYVRLILLVCSVHVLMPLEADLVDQAEMTLAFGSWLSREVLPSIFFLGCCFFCLAMLNVNFGAKQAGLVVMLTGLIAVMHVLLGGVLAWDFLNASLSSLSEWEHSEVFYLQPRTGLTYNRALRVGDQFEWHRERTWPYSVRYEELYFFFFQLLLIWDVICSMLVWFYIFAHNFTGQALRVSYTQLSLGLLWLEHVTVAVLLSYVGVGLSGARLFFRTPAEFGLWWY